MFNVINRNSVPTFITKDGSIIREILAPNNAFGLVRRQSLAEATLAPGGATQPHMHPVTEEIYYILNGTGRVQIETHEYHVVPGDAIIIPSGAAHAIWNTSEEELIFLCCCAPAYTHEDTVFVDLPSLSKHSTG